MQFLGDSSTTRRLLLLVWLLATITLGLQSWVGDKTIYTRALEQKREELHFGILSNQAPGGGSWGEIGALSIQKRVGIVYLAEGLRQLTGLSVAKIYKLTDSFFMFFSLLLLYFYLKKWVPDVYCLLGVLYFCVCLPLTYPFQLFHPWDRPQLAFWIGLLYLLADRRLILLAVGLVVSILVKFDTVLIPFFYFLVYFSRARWRRVGVESLSLLMLAFGTYVALGQLFPAPQDVSHFTWTSAREIWRANAQAFLELNVRYPPLLVHLLPLALALLFLRSKERFVWSSIVFAFGLTGVFVLFTHYEEVRAHMVVLVLILPSALISLRHLLAPSHEVATKI